MKRRKYQKCIAYVIGVTMLLSGMRLSVYAEESTDNTEIVYDQEENEALDDNHTMNSEKGISDKDSIEEENNLNEENVRESVEENNIEDKKYIDKVIIKYQAHVQDIGWQAERNDGEMSGTTGQKKQIEAVRIKFTNENGEVLDNNVLSYRVHIQDIGWQEWKKNGEIAGTTGQKKRIEAIEMKLSNDYSEQYDLYYRCHVQDYGWLGWAQNGQKSGTTGYAKRIEAIEIRLVKKGDEGLGSTENAYRTPKLYYQGHIQNDGWHNKVYDDQMAGTTGQGKRLEALRIELPEETEYTGGILYRVHIQNIGWQSWKNNGELAGTVGEGKRIEAIEIKLTGEMAEYYDIYYSVHLSQNGWSLYTSNGKTAGTTGLSKKVEAVKIILVQKGQKIPGTEGDAYIQGYDNADLSYTGKMQTQENVNSIMHGGEILGTTGQGKRMENIKISLRRNEKTMPEGDIQYAVHLSNQGWTEWGSQGNVIGCTDGTKGMEAFKVRLTGELERYYDIYYRAHVQNYGWLGWAKNGQPSGTTKCGYRLEALQIILIAKEAEKPGENTNYYTEKKYNHGPDETMYNRANMYGSSTQYLLMVDRKNNRTGVYKGRAGNWSCIKYWECAVGRPETPTVTGIYYVGAKGYYFNSGILKCYYYTQFYGDYLFHSVPYYPNGTIYDALLGVPRSQGCVRLQIDNAKWIYDNVPYNTTVVVYN